MYFFQIHLNIKTSLHIAQKSNKIFSKTQYKGNGIINIAFPFKVNFIMENKFMLHSIICYTAKKITF